MVDHKPRLHIKILERN